MLANRLKVGVKLIFPSLFWAAIGEVWVFSCCLGQSGSHQTIFMAMVYMANFHARIHL